MPRGAKKNQQSDIDPTLQINSKEFFDELLKGTEFVMSDSGSMMNNREKIKTPLYVLNCIFGGGIPLGIQEEISGPPAGGKSTLAYSMLGEFQKQHPNDGVGVIIDLEGSTDNIRLKQLGIDPSRIIRLPSESLESAFKNMFTIFNKLIKLKEAGQDTKLFIVFDSLDAGGTEKQHESIEQGGTAMTNAGGMMEKPRILKNNIMNVVPFLEKLDASVHYINQVFTQGIGTYAPKTRKWWGIRFELLMISKLIL